MLTEVAVNYGNLEVAWRFSNRIFNMTIGYLPYFAILWKHMSRP